MSLLFYCESLDNMSPPMVFNAIEQYIVSVWNLFIPMPFGDSYVYKNVGKLFSTYLDYAERICVDAMSLSEQCKYLLSKHHQKEEAQNAYQEEQNRHAIYNNYTPSTNGGFSLTDRAHDTPDAMLKNIHDTYGDDWTKDM